MSYKQIKPHPALADYIDAYWTVSGNGRTKHTTKILPDGCVDIIINRGADYGVDNALTMQHGKAYVVGTMTRFKETILDAETDIVGIRFKPAAFSVFYTFCSLHEITDMTVAFEKNLAPDPDMLARNFKSYLDQFFLRRMSRPRHSLLAVIDDIRQHRGQLTVTALALRHATTCRQLERNFRLHVGVAPKEFINLVRYQCTLPLLQKNAANRSLLDIAFDCGYYDHAHLTNEIKRYTGEAPSRV
jgi:AraC-like DNA-binding protein